MEYYRIKGCCEILDSRRVPITAANRVKGVYPYYGANGIQDYVDGYIFDDELVLLAEDGGNFGSRDKPIAYRVSGKCWVNNHAHVLKPKEYLNADYLCYSLMFYNTDSLVNGATRKKLTQSAMGNMKIPKRTIGEQVRICSILKKVEHIIENYKNQLELLDCLTKSRFVELFGDPVNNPNNWEKIPLSAIAEIKIGPFGSLIHKAEYGRNGHAIINPSHIVDGQIVIDANLTVNNEKYDELSAYQLCKGDVVLGRRGEMGRCAVVEKNGFLCGTGSLFIRPKEKIRPEYLQKILSFPTFKKYIEDKAVGQTMLNLNVEIVSKFQIITPPIGVQLEYYNFVEYINKSRQIIQASLDETQKLFDSLMQQYFG